MSWVSMMTAYVAALRDPHWLLACIIKYFFFGRLIRKEHANANDSHSRWKRYGPAAPPVHMTNR